MLYLLMIILALSQFSETSIQHIYIIIPSPEYVNIFQFKSCCQLIPKSSKVPVHSIYHLV